MKNQFRIIELPEHEVLLIKDTTSETPSFDLIFYHDEIKYTQTFDFNSMATMEKSYNAVGVVDAKSIVESTIYFLNPNDK